jgi:pteridine reductase
LLIARTVRWTLPAVNDIVRAVSGIDLRGRAALVTGGGVRVGRAISLQLARAGCDVLVHYRNSITEARATCDELRALGVRSEATQADLARDGDPERLAQRAVAAFGRLDVVVNSAAAYERVPADDIDRARFEAMLAANLTGPFFLARAAHPFLKAARGALINVLDLNGTSQVWAGSAHYAASKAGLAALTRLLALEWAPEVRVNGVAPGTVLFAEGTPEDERARIERRIPAGRSGIPDDVAAAVLFLATQPFVSGQILAVDGGRSVAP